MVRLHGTSTLKKVTFLEPTAKFLGVKIVEMNNVRSGTAFCFRLFADRPTLVLAGLPSRHVIFPGQKLELRSALKAEPLFQLCPRGMSFFQGS